MRALHCLNAPSNSLASLLRRAVFYASSSDALTARARTMLLHPPKLKTRHQVRALSRATRH
jgi:hypothetical protein